MHGKKEQGWWLEMLDPRIKFLFVFFFTVAMFMAPNRFVFIWNCVLVVSLYLGSGLCKSALIISVLCGVMSLLAYFSGFITNEQTKMTIGLIIFMLERCSIFFILGYWIGAKMKVGSFVSAMQNMHFPKGLTITFAVVFRYLPTVKQEFRYIQNTMKLRGIAPNFKNIITHPVKTMEYAIVPLVIRSMTIADRLAASAMTRGLDLETHRSSYNIVKLGIGDILTGILFIGLTIAGLFINNVLQGKVLL